MGSLLTIVGNGSHGLVEISDGRYLFVNSAVLRSDGAKIIDAMITDGLLSTDEELRAADNATGLNAEQSFEMRSAKRDALSKQKIGTLYIISRKDKVELKERLKNLRVNCQSMRIVSRQEVSQKMLRLCIENIQFNLDFFQLMLWHLIGWFTGKLIPSRFRPSTGGIAILYAHFIAKGDCLSIQLDGIGNSNKDAFYPDKTGKLMQREFNNVHYLADQMIIKSSV